MGACIGNHTEIGPVQPRNASNRVMVCSLNGGTQTHELHVGALGDPSRLTWTNLAATPPLCFSASVSQVRNISRKVTGELWAASKDTVNLVAELERGQDTVKWELDAEDILVHIMWASPEQILLAKTYGDIVIQDNTCLTNRYCD